MKYVLPERMLDVVDDFPERLEDGLDCVPEFLPLFWSVELPANLVDTSMYPVFV